MSETLVAQGKAKVVPRHFIVLGQESQWAAEASECAAEQGRYWEFADALYAKQGRANSGTFSKANLKRIAGELGLAPAFGSCLDSGRYAATVAASTSEGRSRGVTGTPTVFVNGAKLSGPLTFERIAAAVEAAAR